MQWVMIMDKVFLLMVDHVGGGLPSSNSAPQTNASFCLFPQIIFLPKKVNVSKRIFKTFI